MDVEGPLWSCPGCGQRAALLTACGRCELPSEPAPVGQAAARRACEAGRHGLCLRLLEGVEPGPEARALRARALWALGSWGELLSALDEAEGGERDGAWGLLRVRALAELGRHDEALAALGEPTEPGEAMALWARLLLEQGGSGALAERLCALAARHGEAQAELWLLAGRGCCQAAERSQEPGERRELSRRAVEALERHWQAAGPSVEAATWMARALEGAADRGLERLLAVATEGQGRPEWHRALLRSLLEPGGDLDEARKAAERARQLFPDDAELEALAARIHREAWARRRQQAEPRRAAADDEALVSGAPEFLTDLRARIRRGALPPTRELPAAQREIIEVLCRYERANAVVTGPPGSGKSALLRSVAHQLHERRGMPAMLHPYGLFELDPIGIVGGTDNVGVLEGRLTALARFCEAHKIILFVDNFHLILGAGSYTGRPAGLSELLQPLMSSGNVKIVAACNDESFDALARSVGLERRVTRVRLPSMRADEAAALLDWMRPRLEEHYGLAIAPPMLPLAARLAGDQIKQRALPDSAVDLLERAGAKALVDGAPALHEDHLLAALSQLLMVPVDQVRLDRMTRLLRLEELLAERVVGQPDAIGVVADVVRVCKADLGLSSARPDGVFLFVGPSGVGKTELARALAETLHNDPESFIRLDMSEFAEAHNVSRLFGTTPGYVGFEQEGQLTAALRLNPGSVVLLDEIEKAHPKVYDVFLQVFDAGRLTDGRGKTVDCSRATFILTSNLGTAELIEGRVGFLRGREGRSDRERVVRGALERHFRPEFLNRLDSVVVFDALSEATLHAIVAQKFVVLRSRFAARAIDLTLDEALIPLVASQTDRLRTGARGVLQTIERLLVVPLARRVLGQPDRRSFHVHLDQGQVKISP